MGCFNDYYMIKVEDENNAMNSIREAIKNFSHEECTMKQEGNVIRVWDTYRVDEQISTACDFVRLLARAANGVNFTMEGSNEYSCGGGTMFYAAELKDGELTFRHTDWCDECNCEEFEEYETYEDYCEEYGEDSIASEEDFIRAKENEFTYHLDGKVYVDLPLGEVIHVEY